MAKKKEMYIDDKIRKAIMEKPPNKGRKTWRNGKRGTLYGGSNGLWVPDELCVNEDEVL